MNKKNIAAFVFYGSSDLGFLEFKIMKKKKSSDTMLAQTETLLHHKMHQLWDEILPKREISGMFAS